MYIRAMRFSWKNFLFRIYLKVAFPPGFTAQKSIRHQRQILGRILKQLKHTQLGAHTGLQQVKSYNDFRALVPVTRYDFYEPFIEKIKAGEKNVLTRQPVKWFAKTAGTTSGKSKLVPVTRQIMRKCHVRGSFFALSVLHHYNKNLHLLSHKNLLIPGGIYETLPNGIIIGDISGILVRNVPYIYRPYYVPSINVQTFARWEEKINETVKQVIHEDVGTMSGVPTWILSALQQMKREFPFEKLADVWKNLQVYFHGGVSFEPYRRQFEELVGKPGFNFYEIYNATEGFFGIQQNLQSQNMLLLTDNYIFYEFIPLDKFYAGNYSAVSLTEVKSQVPYVMLITAPNGLLRYAIGDVITFQSLDPFTFKITGRTQQYINAFGEDLLVSNVENALIKTNRVHGCTISDYTVAPLYISIEQKGKIQVAVEFTVPPASLAAYQQQLDENLQAENYNYRQKRANNLALEPLQVIALQPGVFYKWLELKNKIGGQNKVPRLVNGREVMDEILAVKSDAV